MAGSEKIETELEGLDLSLGSCRSSSTSPNESSSGSDINDALRPQTSGWIGPAMEGKAQESQFVGSKNRDVMQFIPVIFADHEFDFDLKYRCIAALKTEQEIQARDRWQKMCPKDALLSPGQQQLLKKLDDIITMDINKTPCIVDKDRYRRPLLHGGYPDEVPEAVWLKVHDDLQTTRKKLTQLLTGLADKDVDEDVKDVWYIQHLVMQARKFVDAIHLYLTQQPTIREYGIAELFSAFAAVAGINFSCGKSISPRTMKVLGVDVLSETYLRAHVGMLTHPLQETIPRVVDATLKVVAIAEVKAAPPDIEMSWKDSLHPVVGQLLGEMLLEMPHSVASEQVVAFAVQSTVVRVSHLTIPRVTLKYVQDSDHDSEHFHHEHFDSLPLEKGYVDWSVQLDIMKKGDRIQLWKFMFKLANSAMTILTSKE